MIVRSLVSVIAIAATILATGAAARAQSEFPPPAGKGRIVVVVSGQLGAAAYETEAKRIAALGYDVVLLDGNAMEGSHGESLMTAISSAASSPHGLPGKVGVVGFSLGGGEALGYASRRPDLVAVVVAFYPLTSKFKDLTSFGALIKVPVLMLAGEADAYKDCCTIGNARILQAAAAAAGAPFELVSYPGAGHDFIKAGHDYDSAAADDSWQRTTAKLAQYLGQ